MQEDRQSYSLKLKTDGGRFIGICVGIDIVVGCAGTRYSNSDYLLVIDRPGLLEFLAGVQQSGWVGPLGWEDWESGITTILPLENSSHMAWAVFGRRIVINAEAETLPFGKSVEVANENKAGNDGHKNDEDQGSGDQEVPATGERLIVVDFGCPRLTSVIEAGDASGNIIRIRSLTRGEDSLWSVVEFPSEELPCRIWMERVSSCLPSKQVHMSESTILVVDVSC